MKSKAVVLGMSSSDGDIAKLPIECVVSKNKQGEAVRIIISRTSG